MAYSQHGSGNASRDILFGRGAGIDLTGGLSGIVSAATGVIGIVGEDNTVAANIELATGDIEFVAKEATNVSRVKLNIDDITDRLELTVGDRGSAATTTISTSLTDITDTREYYVLRLQDFTEGTEPTHWEEYRTTGTGNVYDAIVAAYTSARNKYDREGVGIEPRWTIAKSGANLTITANDSETVGQIILTRYNGTSTPLVTTEITNQLVGKGALSNTQITPEQIAQIRKESIQYGGGFNETGFMRGVDENIGDGGPAAAIGDTVLIISYSTSDYSKSVPKTVAEFNGQLIIVMSNTNAIAAVKKHLGYS